MPRKKTIDRERRGYHLPVSTLTQMQGLVNASRPTETAVIIAAVDLLARVESGEVTATVRIPVYERLTAEEAKRIAGEE